EIIIEWLDETVLKEYETVPDTDRLERITFSQDVVPNVQYTFQIYERTQNITFLLSTPGKRAAIMGHIDMSTREFGTHLLTT
ncbi:unnamed protein product, partial [Allacma fusca]